MKKLIEYALIVIASLALAFIICVWYCYDSYVCEKCMMHRGHSSQTGMNAGVAASTETGAKKMIYTCPMHPQVVSDKPGKCPICGMDLVLKEAAPETPQAGETVDMIAMTGRTAINVSEGRRQLIGLKTGAVKSEEAVKEIRTVGRVAFNAELAVAQREYLEAAKLGDSLLIRASKDRLKLLGMNDPEIANLKEVQRELYLPDTEAWVYPVVYEDELPDLKVGQTVSVAFLNGKNADGVIKSIDTLIDPMTRTARLHVLLENPGFVVRPEEFVVAKIKINLGVRLLVPKSAVISTGERNLVFLVHEGGHFIPREVDLGQELADYYVVGSGLADGDQVVTSAAFLIDSESRLKAALEATGKVLNGEGHKH